MEVVKAPARLHRPPLNSGKRGDSLKNSGEQRDKDGQGGGMSGTVKTKRGQDKAGKPK